MLTGLRFSDEAGRRRILRKLHVRWWHASTAQMTNILRQAGVSSDILRLIPSIVDTCSACRTWQRPSPAAQATTNVAGAFNDIVEGDLVFYKDFIIFHLVDRCTRWQASKHIPNKSTDTLIEAMEDCWVSTFGPMKQLIFDHETGLMKSDKAATWFGRKGIKFEPRAVGQHARYAERRGEILKQTLRRIDEQLTKENIDVPF